ncbi:MAG: hypothetical protein GF355_06720 [Candidatus Eisenbacteria bacterium]|nr:hypothetical protein [Candidatus Eisenbacteria bacterium]
MLRRRMLGLLILMLIQPAVGESSAAAGSDPALAAYMEDVDRLVMAPGASPSVAAGFVNPAAWPIQNHAGLYLALEDAERLSFMRSAGLDEDAYEISDFRGALSLGGLGFAMKRLSLESCGSSSDHYDYTLGLGVGDRSHALGISYSWTRGGWPDVANGEAVLSSSERITVGHISRCRPFSLGLSGTWDLDRKDDVFQADIGLRPYQLGSARVTLFADAALKRGDDAEDVVFGYGADVHLIPGVNIGVRARNTGAISVRFGLGWRSGRSSYRHHMNNDGERVSSTYAVEFAPGPHIGQAIIFEKTYPEMNLGGPVAYRTFRWFDDRRRFLQTLQEINSYADDVQVGGVVVNLSGLRASPAMLWELRAQLAGLRERGKTVIVYIDRGGLAAYALATVADELWMDPYGDLELTGVNLGRTYYHRLLEKIGIGVNEWRFFTYKSAFEALSRESMSDPDREQIDAFVEDLYEEAVEVILAGRGLSREEWDRVVSEKGVLLADEALEAGLVDSLGDFHDAKKRAGKAAPRTTHDVDVAHLAGVMGDQIWGPEEWGEPPRIAVLYAIGPCQMDSGIHGRLLSKTFRKMRRKDLVKAVVMRADSPGGDPLPSDLVAREMKSTAEEKPVIVSQGQVAGSGGYWISMHADTILASPPTVTGSIGVIGGHLWNKEFGEKVGIDYDHVQRGDHADAMDGPVLPLIGIEIPDRSLTHEELERVEILLKDMYWDFVDQVAEGRNMSREAVDHVAQGRIWSGVDGLDIGLVDEIGGLWRGLQLAKKGTGLDPDRYVELIEGPELGLFHLGFIPQPRFFGLQLPWGKPSVEDGGGEILTGGVWDRLPESERRYLETILRAQPQPVLMMPPLGIESLTGVE